MSLFSRNEQNASGNEENRRKGDPNLRIGIAAIVSIYIIYLGIDLLKAGVTRSTEGMSPWVAALFGLFFIGAGGFYAWISVRSYIATRKEMEAEAAKEHEAQAEKAQSERAFFAEASRKASVEEPEAPSAEPAEADPGHPEETVTNNGISE